MAQIEYITGDLLEGDEVLIVHGCNAQGRMGSGIAGVIRKKWPHVYDAYRDHYEKHLGEDILGEVIWADATDTKVVANAITQKFCGPRGQRYVSYDAIAKAFETIDEFAYGAELSRVGMPLIGADLGGGSWKVISAIIESTSLHYTPRVYVLPGASIPTT